MNAITQPLHDEHQGLIKSIQHLCQSADLVGHAPVLRVLVQVDQDYRFLTRQLLPHAEAEDAVLYPIVAQLMGSPQATATMQRDHVEVAAYVDELRHLRDELRASGDYTNILIKELRRVLYGLYAIIMLHFAKEEELYLPILDQSLSPNEAHQMFESMDNAAHVAKGHVNPR